LAGNWNSSSVMTEATAASNTNRILAMTLLPTMIR
jgi:hypothetical protein